MNSPLAAPYQQQSLFLLPLLHQAVNIIESWLTFMHVTSDTIENAISIMTINLNVDSMLWVASLIIINSDVSVKVTRDLSFDTSNMWNYQRTVTYAFTNARSWITGVCWLAGTYRLKKRHLSDSPCTKLHMHIDTWLKWYHRNRWHLYSFHHPLLTDHFPSCTWTDWKRSNKCVLRSIKVLDWNRCDEHQSRALGSLECNGNIELCTKNTYHPWDIPLNTGLIVDLIHFNLQHTRFCNQ